MRDWAYYYFRVRDEWQPRLAAARRHESAAVEQYEALAERYGARDFVVAGDGEPALAFHNHPGPGWMAVAGGGDGPVFYAPDHNDQHGLAISRDLNGIDALGPSALIHALGLTRHVVDIGDGTIVEPDLIVLEDETLVAVPLGPDGPPVPESLESISEAYFTAVEQRRLLQQQAIALH